jgi:NhaP-type Na+/H+ and K+/H+ antiporter
MDVHVPKSISVVLRLRGNDVLTGQENGAILFDDVVLYLSQRRKESSLSHIFK